MMGLIHVGAWDGSEYIAEAVHHPRDLLLFEPQADAFKRLEANLIGHEAVMMFQVALGATKGSARMHTASPDHSSSLLVPKKQRDLFPQITFNGEMETVELTTLDAVIKEHKLAGLYDEMVVDVQGYELEVLKGAEKTLPDLQKIICEVNTDEVYEDCARMDEIDAFLEVRGFARTETDMWGGICGDATYVKTRTDG